MYTNKKEWTFQGKWRVKIKDALGVWRWSARGPIQKEQPAKQHIDGDQEKIAELTAMRAGYIGAGYDLGPIRFQPRGVLLGQKAVVDTPIRPTFSAPALVVSN